MTELQLLLKYLPVLETGAIVTLQLSSLSLLFGSIVGVLVGMMRSSRRLIFRGPATVYVELFRSVPILLQLFFIYYGLPLVFGIDIPSYPAAILALSLYCGSYMAEVVKSGIESVPIGQWEASYSIGMRYLAAFRHVILPQAARVALPPAVSVCIITIKDSSLASVIGFLELTGTGIAIRQSTYGKDIGGILLAVAAIYFIINYSISLAGQALEKRVHI